MKKTMFTICCLLTGLLVINPSLSYSDEAGAMQKKKEKIEQRINKLDKKINKLETQAQNIEDQQRQRAWNNTISETKKALENQWQKLSNASESTFDAVAEGVESMLTQSKETYRDLKRNVEQWQTEQRLSALEEQRTSLKAEAKEMGNKVKNKLSSSQMTLNNKLLRAKEELSVLKKTSKNTWQEQYTQTQKAIDEAELSLTYLERSVYKWNTEKKLSSYEMKIQDLRNKLTNDAEQDKQAFNSAIEELEDTWQEAKDQITDWSSHEENQWKSFKDSMDDILMEVKQNYEEAKEFVTS